MQDAAVKPEAPNPQDASLILELQHRRLDEMLGRVEIAFEIGAWSEAQNLFGGFQAELDEHIRIEEDLMFPSFEAFTRGTGGPTTVMRREHHDIGRCVDLIEDLLQDEQPIGEQLEFLEALLSGHNAKEEQVLYPLFERHAPPEAYAALVKELRPLFEG